MNVKRAALISAILALFLMGAKPTKTALVRLTIVNKSGVELFIHLDNLATSYKDDVTYSLTIPEGDHEAPTVKEFTIYRDIYDVQVYYVENWDPVYGYTICGNSTGKTQLNAKRQHRWVFTECSRERPRPGEPTMEKFYRGSLVGKGNIE
jgi:hypothetical protein